MRTKSAEFVVILDRNLHVEISRFHSIERGAKGRQRLHETSLQQTPEQRTREHARQQPPEQQSCRKARVAFEALLFRGQIAQRDLGDIVQTGLERRVERIGPTHEAIGHGEIANFNGTHRSE